MDRLREALDDFYLSFQPPIDKRKIDKLAIQIGGFYCRDAFHDFDLEDITFLCDVPEDIGRYIWKRTGVNWIRPENSLHIVSISSFGGHVHKGKTDIAPQGTMGGKSGQRLSPLWRRVSIPAERSQPQQLGGIAVEHLICHNGIAGKGLLTGRHRLRNTIEGIVCGKQELILPK